ncbi:sugar nucleotide-binding protein [Paenibacillus protaetiae]|uniref:dTDP-4-dehydrorhamnose reductase n=1 Tax=Paenibacillus protaetiae TaxID=2509456 RepID=A0A4P6EVW3_9BACL|nr:sugar nucleotide-binding protein [Paenibacillus protaetiae]QAY66313.1 dTDP-4-dehydrorhamnose reductase [Paenibacillus protaetiae]
MLITKQFQLDMEQYDKLQEQLKEMNPDIVISCLRGDYGRQLEFHMQLAAALAEGNSRLYYLSTTNVFDGDVSKPHTEADNPIAVSDYGKFKISCENMLKRIMGERLVIIRIPAIWGKPSPRWDQVKESIKNNKEIDVYSNLVCSHLLDVQLARQLRYILKQNLRGIFHLGSVDEMTHGQFHERLVQQITGGSRLLRYHLYDDKEDTRYFSLASSREGLPGSLQSTNSENLAYLLE